MFSFQCLKGLVSLQYTHCEVMNRNKYTQMLHIHACTVRVEQDKL